MRWKLLLRRLSVSAPRVIVRSHLPWPLRWAVVAVALGFSAAIALWAFEFGREIAGLDRNQAQELEQLRSEVGRLRQERDSAQAVANTAGSLLTAERATQQRLGEQIRGLETEGQVMKSDLAFFERLLPAAGDGLQVRALRADPQSPGQLRYQLLVMQSGRATGDFNGRYELLLGGTLDGRPWTFAMPGGPKPLQLRQSTRVEGLIEHPSAVVLKTVQARVTDAQGEVRASHLLRLP